MCNLINTHTHTQIHTSRGERAWEPAISQQKRSRRRWRGGEAHGRPAVLQSRDPLPERVRRTASDPGDGKGAAGTGIGVGGGVAPREAPKEPRRRNERRNRVGWQEKKASGRDWSGNGSIIYAAGLQNDFGGCSILCRVLSKVFNRKTSVLSHSERTYRFGLGRIT